MASLIKSYENNQDLSFYNYWEISMPSTKEKISYQTQVLIEAFLKKPRDWVLASGVSRIQVSNVISKLAFTF